MEEASGKFRTWPKSSRGSRLKEHLCVVLLPHRRRTLALRWDWRCSNGVGTDTVEAMRHLRGNISTVLLALLKDQAGMPVWPVIAAFGGLLTIV